MMKDKIKLNLEIEADYQTLQDIRKYLADIGNKDTFILQIDRLTNLNLGKMTKGKFTTNLTFSIPKPHSGKKGKRIPIPRIRNGVLSEYDTESESFKVIGDLGSYEALSFLDWQKSFNYKSVHGLSFTGTKQNGVWYARKRLDGNDRRLYLGDHTDFTEKKLGDMAFKISQRKLL